MEQIKEYKMIYLNNGMQLSCEKDLQNAENAINEYIARTGSCSRSFHLLTD